MRYSGAGVGIKAVRTFRERFAPLLDVVWVDAPRHDKGLDLLVERHRRDLSLVDATSFVVMREHHMDEAFAFDPDFVREGFRVVTDAPPAAERDETR